jgi:PAS domain S-box-containing protein
MKQDNKHRRSPEKSSAAAPPPERRNYRENDAGELEKRLQRALHIGRIFSWEMNPATRELVWSDNMEEVIGFSLFDDIDKTFELFHPDDAAATIDAINRAIATGGEYESEYRLVDPASGEVGWFRSQGGMTDDAADGPPRFSGITQNITERKRAELNAEFLSSVTQDLAQLQTANEMMRVVSAKIGAYLNVESCIFVEIEEAGGTAVALYDWYKSERPPGLAAAYPIADFVAGKNPQNAAPGDVFVVRDTEKDERVVAEAFRPFGVKALIVAPLLKGGKRRFALDLNDAEPRDWRTDEIELACELAARVWNGIERARAEEALRESEEKYRSRAAELRAVVESMSDAVYIGGMEGMTIANRSALDQLGYETFEELSRNIGTLAEEIDTRDAETGQVIPAERQPFARALGGEHVVQEVKVRHRLTGDERFVRCAASPVVLGGEVIAAVAVNTDITERKRRETNQAFLAGIADDLSRLVTVDEIMKTVGAKIGTYLSVKSCLLIDVDDARGEVTVFEAWNAADVPSLRHRTIRLADFINEEFARANRAGEMVVVRDTNFDPRVEGRDYKVLGLGAFVTVPFHRKGAWTNYLAVTDFGPRDWRDDEIELFRELSNRIFPRLERARAEEKLRRSEAGLAAELADTQQLQKISSQLIREDNADALYEQILDAACALMRSEMGSLQMFFPERKELFLLAWRGFDPRTAPASTGGAALNEGRRTICEDVEIRAFRAGAEDLEFYRRSGIRAFQTTPLISRAGHIVGMISNHWREPHRPSVRDLRLLDVLARQAADLIERRQAVAALRESEERLRLIIKSVEDYAIITTDTKGIINGWNPGAERIFGFTPDEILGQNAELLFTPEDRKKGVPAKEMQNAIKKGSADDERFHLRKDGTLFYASGVMHPLKDGKIEGFVKIARDMTERLKAEKAHSDKEILQRLIGAQEDERRRIARDLHDELGQQLTALRLKLDEIQKLCKDNEDLCARIVEVQEAAGRIDDGVDFLTWELRPIVLDDLGLRAALEKYVQEWSQHAGVEAEFIHSGQRAIRFTPEIEINLYRIVQEALNNIHKHAKANRAGVILDKRGDAIVLIVEDDGVGFNPKNKKTRAKGLGLLGMKERTVLVGGIIEIESKLKMGTTIYVRVPLVDRPAPSIKR